MFPELRRKDRKLNTEQAYDILLKGDYGTLSTISINGYPYGVPLDYVYINDAIYFHSAIVGHKLENILRNNKVTFSVVENYEHLPEKFSTRYKSVIVFGEAQEVEGEEKYQALLALIKKYAPNNLINGMKYIEKYIDQTKVLKIIIQHLTGKERK